MTSMAESMAATGRDGTGAELRAHIWFRSSRQRDRETGLGWTFETCTASPRGTHPPTRLHLLILSKWFHQLGTKCSNLCLWGPLLFRPPHLTTHQSDGGIFSTEGPSSQMSRVCVDTKANQNSLIYTLRVFARHACEGCIPQWQLVFPLPQRHLLMSGNSLF